MLNQRDARCSQQTVEVAEKHGTVLAAAGRGANQWAGFPLTEDLSILSDPFCILVGLLTQIGVTTSDLGCTRDIIRSYPRDVIRSYHVV